jgi:hypothetical protein
MPRASIRVTRAFGGHALFASMALVAALASPAFATTFIAPGSLLISSTTYADLGAAAALVAGSSVLPGSKAGKTAKATADGSFLNVFNNETPDPAFGVTSAIKIQDLNANSGAVLQSLDIDPSVVSTSFSSKSELSLNITKTSNGPVATFMGYAGGGVGTLDVSNSDTTAYIDSTNPVTSTYSGKLAGNPNYAFNRAVVALNADGTYSTTQTLAYGGNNGRAAVLGANGQYYTVGNSNNGSGTPTQLTTSTGLEVVTPGATANSQMIDPSYQSIIGDKAGKDANFRGLTVFDNQLYFTKGSGSNGIDTVYTVSEPNGQLPTAADAASATISILPGLPTDSAKVTGGNFTPFGLFFANATTMYVADEGTGNALDMATNAGLEKWSLIGGVWSLDYTLQDGLIGSTYTVSGTNSGVAGTWPTVTSAGLRDITGRVNADGTVTLWGVTSTRSASTDNGADPNEIVEITDLLGALTDPGSESFSVYDGPQYGVRYGGVALAPVPEPATWALMLIGFGALGGGLRRRRALAKGVHHMVGMP